MHCCNVSVVAAGKTALVALFLEIVEENNRSVCILVADLARSVGPVIGGGGGMTASRKRYGLSNAKGCDGGIGERL